jgi:hypothetical protein
LKYRAVHEAEHGGRRADADREREERHQREPGAAADEARAVADVPHDGFDEREHAAVAIGVLHRLDGPEAFEGGGARGIRRHPRALEFVRLHLDVRANLLVEIRHSFDAERGEQAHGERPEQSRRAQPRHDALLPGARNRRIVSEATRQRSSSTTSRRRPVRVIA